MKSQETEGVAQELVLIADQLRALSNNGLIWSKDPYQTERYHRILGLAARLMDLADARSLAEIEAEFFRDIDVRTPLAVVDTAVFDRSGRLLMIQRADDHTWAMPGGACDVGEAPPAGGAREVWEETGYRVRIIALLGVFDSRYSGTRSSRHLYHLLFAGEVAGGEPTTSNETLDVQWIAPEDIPWQKVHAGHGPRIRHALAWYADSATRAFFDSDEGSI